ncbi:MAG: hypothetical protein Q9224_006087, partial [Gallowayella concinna]
AQQCQNYWKGTAPVCKPDDSCDAAHHFFGITDKRGDGAVCFTGKKNLCQCIASGGKPACQPNLPPKTFTIMRGWVTMCDNGCNVYTCGVKFFHFWKKREEQKSNERGLRGVLRRRLPCEEAPEQRHCQQPDPDPPLPQPSPTNDISSKPLTPNDVLNSFRQTEAGALAGQVAGLGENTGGKSKDDLVQLAYNHFQSSMIALDLANVDAQASFQRFEQGQSALIYIDGRPSPVET